MESDELLPNDRRASGGRSGRGLPTTTQDVSFALPGGGSQGMTAGGRGRRMPNYSSANSAEDGGDVGGGSGGDGGGGSSKKRMGKARSFTIPLVMPGTSMMRRAKSSAGLLMRQNSGPDEAIWSAEEVAKEDVETAISRDLVAKAERWKQLAGEPLNQASVMPLLAKDVDKHEVASIYVKDALAGRNSSACIHDKQSVRAVNIFRNKAWNHLLNICTVLHLALPMVQIQRCLPCIGTEQLAEDADVLHIGWRPTMLGSMWIESVLCVLYAYHLRQEAVSRLGTILAVEEGGSTHRIAGGEEDDEEGGEESGCTRDHAESARPEVYSLFALPPWQLARTIMVALLGLSLLANLLSHYTLGITWFSWRHVILPFLFISRRTYLKHFVAATFRLLPRMVPVVFLISFITFFYGFLGYVVYRDEPHDSPVLSDLDLFDEAPSSALTFLRIFTARSFMIDVDKIYGARRDMEVMVLSYGVIMFIFLLALVPAVATHNFIGQSKKSYHWVKQQRKVALTRAHMLLKKPDGTVAREDFVKLMTCLRPDCDQEHTSALFTAAKKAEEQQNKSGVANSALAVEDERNRLSKDGFFMLCALGTADFSRRQNERMMMTRKKRTSRERGWARTRRKMNAALLYTRPGGKFPVSQQVLNVALLIQGYQIIKSGDDVDERPVWAYPLGAFLIFFFFLHSAVQMVAGGTRAYFLEWRNNLDMFLNLCGIAFYAGLWPGGRAFHSLYQILQALRLELLWVNVHLLGPISSGVATRLEFVFPAVIRASFVLFAVTYAYAVVAYAMYCDTPLGRGDISDFKDDAMVQRFAGVKTVSSFATLPQSFTSMMYVVMFSNWPLFMDAAGEVGNLAVAKIFFYSFKVVGFYFVMPVLLGSTVTSYINVQVPEADDGSTKPSPGTASSTGSPPPPHPGGGSTMPARGWSEVGPGAGATDGERRNNGDEKEETSSPAVNMGRKSLYRRSSFSDDITSRNKDGTKFGYSTLADGPNKEIDVNALVARGSEETLVDNGDAENESEGSRDGDKDDREDSGGDADAGNGDSGRPRGDGYSDERDGAETENSSADDNYAPIAPCLLFATRLLVFGLAFFLCRYNEVIVESRSRSLSQTFWGVHQAKDRNPATLLQGALSRLEAEIIGLRAENASLRAAASSREASARLYVAEMEEETKGPAGDSNTSSQEASRRAGVDIGLVNAAGEMGKPLFSTSPEVVNSLRSRVISSANTIWGMPAIFETEDGARASDDVV